MIIHLSKHIKIEINEDSIYQWEQLKDKEYLITVKDNKDLTEYLINVKEQKLEILNKY